MQNAQNNVQNERPKAVWTRVFTETHKESGISVTVSKRGSRYSMGFSYSELRRSGEGNIVLPFLPIDIQQVEPGRFALAFDVAAVVAELANKAKEWAVNDRAQSFDAFIERRLEQEHKQADRFKKGTRITGKTAKKKAKLKKGGDQAAP